MDLTVPLRREGKGDLHGRREESPYYIGRGMKRNTNSFDGFCKMRYDEEGIFIGRRQRTAGIPEEGLKKD